MLIPSVETREATQEFLTLEQRQESASRVASLAGDATCDVETDLATVFQPLTPNFASLSIQDGFDWEAIMQVASQRPDPGEGPFYLVVFRSQLKVGADRQLLGEHDREAHQAALESPSLVHYFAGEPDADGRALSFCLWTNREDARTISQDSRHSAAMQMVSMYQWYELEKYSVPTNGPVALTKIN